MTRKRTSDRETTVTKDAERMSQTDTAGRRTESDENRDRSNGAETVLAGTRHEDSPHERTCTETHVPADVGLVSNRKKRMRDQANPQTQREWQRPYWLGGALSLILFAFWILDSLKDPVFGNLVDGNLDTHQPPAKLFSVLTTLILVCLIEYISNRRQRLRQEMAVRQVRPASDVMDPGGVWSSMNMDSEACDPHQHHVPDDVVSVSTFFVIGIPYIVLFAVFANILSQPNAPVIDQSENTDTHTDNIHNVTGSAANAVLPRSDQFDGWYALGYILYASIESFGSLIVASFWSYTNSTLSLTDAERYYGPIIALAQLGAIGGATTVASKHWSSMQLFVLACLIISLLLIIMHAYQHRFPPTSHLAVQNSFRHRNRIQTWQDNNVTLTQPFWSGIILILKHRYVLLILGVSCLYEVSLTCLDYQMKLLGWNRFENIAAPVDSNMSFSQFMGRYGQVVNGTSLLVSSMLFPWLLKRVGLRITIRLFPTLLVLATLVAYIALPGNLAALFLSLSLLKAMTYSLHDPSKELLYLPTSNAIKFRSKFWIDVVGARLSKAFGSALNTYAGSVNRSIQIGGWPSLLTAVALLWTSYAVGEDFNQLLQNGDIVGLEADLDDERDTYISLAGSDDCGCASSGEIDFVAVEADPFASVEEDAMPATKDVSHTLAVSSDGMKTVELTAV